MNTNITIKCAGVKLLPCDVDQFYYVYDICISNCEITSIPDEFYDILKLKYLNLGFNRISTISHKISKLINLYTLMIYNNLLSEIPKEIGNLTGLRLISISNNKINELPVELTKLINLNSFYIYANPVCDNGTVPKILPSTKIFW